MLQRAPAAKLAERTLLRVEAVGLLILLIVLFAAFWRAGSTPDRSDGGRNYIDFS